MQDQLRNKQRELLELQKRKLELELAATKKHIEEQEKQLNMKTASIKPTVSFCLICNNLFIQLSTIKF